MEFSCFTSFQYSDHASSVTSVVQFNVVLDVCDAGLELSIGEVRLNRAVDANRRGDIDFLASGA